MKDLVKFYKRVNEWNARAGVQHHPTFSTEWEENGFYYSNIGKYKKYRNKITGVQRRSRVNLLSREKRMSLLSNIV